MGRFTKAMDDGVKELLTVGQEHWKRCTGRKCPSELSTHFCGAFLSSFFLMCIIQDTSLKKLLNYIMGVVWHSGYFQSKSINWASFLLVV